MPIPGMKMVQKLDKPGVVRLKCAAGHTWMSAFVVVKAAGAAAVTGADGVFRIDGVTPGPTQIEIWHEKLGSWVVPVDVGGVGETRVDLAW